MDVWTRQEDPQANPAARLAALWYQLGHGQGDRNLAVIPYSDRLEPLGRLLQQLLMESIGKRHDRQGEVVEQGLTVYGNKGSSDQHALLQQLLNGRNDTIVFLFQVLDSGKHHSTTDFQVEDALQHFLLGTRRALMDRRL